MIRFCATYFLFGMFLQMKRTVFWPVVILNIDNIRKRIAKRNKQEHILSPEVEETK